MQLKKGKPMHKWTFINCGMETYFHNPRIDPYNKTLYMIIVIFLMAILTATGFRMSFWPIDSGNKLNGYIGSLKISSFIFLFIHFQ